MLAKVLFFFWRSIYACLLLRSLLLIIWLVHSVTDVDAKVSLFCAWAGVLLCTEAGRVSPSLISSSGSNKQASRFSSLSQVTDTVGSIGTFFLAVALQMIENLGKVSW